MTSDARLLIEPLPAAVGTLHDRIGKVWSDSRVQVTQALIDRLIHRIEVEERLG